MTTPITALTLRDTGHVLAAFTRKSVDEGKLANDQLEEQFRNGLPLRRVPQTELTMEPPDGDIDQRSPAEVLYRITPEHMEAHALPMSDRAVISRPARFTIDAGSAVMTPRAVDKLDSMTYTIKTTGVEVRLKPLQDELISDDLRIICLMFVAKTGQTVVENATIQKSIEADQEAVGTIPFAGIPTGEPHHFLFLIDGFQPIWDTLEVTGTRTWKQNGQPTQPA